MKEDTSDLITGQVFQERTRDNEVVNLVVFRANEVEWIIAAFATHEKLLIDFPGTLINGEYVCHALGNH